MLLDLRLKTKAPKRQVRKQAIVKVRKGGLVNVAMLGRTD